jgi:hypothetical protein
MLCDGVGVRRIGEPRRCLAKDLHVVAVVEPGLGLGDRQGESRVAATIATAGAFEVNIHAG